jgi:hypothetical protein
MKIVGTQDDPELDRIDKVTSSALTRVGNPISFALQDESGLATKSNKMVDVYETQRRGAAGMGGRTMETSNAWDPSQNSVAQRTHEANAPDVFKFFREPPANLSYRNKRERRKIHAFVYEGSPWVDLDSIEAEAAELMLEDPAQAARFFGNKVGVGTGAWLDDDALAAWDKKWRPGGRFRCGRRSVSGSTGRRCRTGRRSGRRRSISTSSRRRMRWAGRRSGTRRSSVAGSRPGMSWRRWSSSSSTSG